MEPDQVTIKAVPADQPPMDLSVHPVVSDLRERLARVEERTENALDHNPVASTAMEVATAARSTAEAALQKVTELATKSAAAVAHEEKETLEVEPPAAIQDPVETLESQPVDLPAPEPRKSFFHRFL